MTSYKTDGTVGPWAEEKLKCLEGYLNAYTKVLLNQTWCDARIYIDAFAGAGQAPLRKSGKKEKDKQSHLFDEFPDVFEGEEETTYIKGSPTVALEILHPFTHYFFIEHRPDNVAKLQELKNESVVGSAIEILEDDANVAIIKNILANDSFDWKKDRGVVFLDPFGMQVVWGTVEAIAATRALEIIINLPVGTTLQRLFPRSGKFTEEKRRRLDDYFGSPEWYEIIYEKTPGLFGDELNKANESGRRLAQWYQSRLKKLFGLASPARLIKNSQGGHLYYLIWAGRHPLGLKIASHILRQGESVE